MNAARTPGPRWLPWTLTTVFLVVGLLRATRHEMWRDEMNAWLTVRDSASLAELIGNLAYGGHPALWYLCLKALHVIFGSPWSMQVFAVGVAATAVFVMARWSPFSAAEKVLLATGYFVCYEYAIVARNYGLGMLLGFAICAIWPARRERWFALCLLLALLAQTSALGLVLTVALLTVLTFDAPPERRIGPWWLGTAAVLVSIVLSVATILPPADSGFATQWYVRHDAARWSRIAQAFRDAFTPLPPIGLSSWGRNLANEPSWRTAATLFALLTTGITGAAFARHKQALWLLLLGMSGTAALLYLKLDGSIRHHGYLFLVFAMAHWLHRNCESPRASGEYRIVVSSAARMAFSAVLLVHVMGGLSISISDWRHPFSMARTTASYLETQQLAAEPVVAYLDAAAAGVLGYGGIRSAFYLQGEREGSFIIWDSARVALLPPNDVACGALRYSARRGTSVVLLANRPLALGRHDGSFTPLARFDGAIIPDENFSLTRVDAAQGSGLTWCATAP